MARKPKLIETAAAPTQAPDEGNAAPTQATAPATSTAQADEEVVKRKIAKHELLGADGAVVDEEENAHGMRYTLLGNGQSFDWMYGKNPDADRMLAIFGAKTLATNETSATRQKNGPDSHDDQIAAVKERFALLETNAWVDRTREGVGAKINLDALAEAICQVLVAEGKVTAEQIASGYKADRRQRLDDDPAYARKVRTYAPVAVAYAAIVGKTTASVDDLLA